MRHTLPPEFCDGCTMSHALDLGNRVAWEVFTDAITQIIFEPVSGRIAGLSHEAIWRLIDEHEPDDTLATFALVHAAEGEFVKVQSEKYERARKRHKLKQEANQRSQRSRGRLPVAKGRRHR